MSKTNVNLNWKYRIRTFVLFIFWALLTILTGCAGFIRSITPPMIPIQTASVTQIEFYRQWYNFENLNQADRVFKNLVGEKNWELLKAKYIESKDDLLNEIEVQGSIVLKISPVPGDLDCFFMEGIGRYFLINRKNKAIMLSGDYYIKNKRFSINDLVNGVILLDTKQYIIHFFSDDQYYQDIPIFFKIHMKTISEEKHIYSINYQAKHEVIFNDELIGFLEFDKSSPSQDKLIDLRGRRLIYDDYTKIAQKNRSKENKTSETYLTTK